MLEGKGGHVLEKATFGGGCFWQVEVEYRNTPGVRDAAVGYMGGVLENPSYEQVCTDRTGHAEVVQVDFDPEEISYEQLVERFFEVHDPTQLDRQGPDFGSQYRSVIFFHSPEQERTAEAVKERVAPGFARPIVTRIDPATTFWPAEDYHQQYLVKRGMATCRI
jgi:peptide-methionine (S)-S-oxide reductase